jgi:hypothetical protein
MTVSETWRPIVAEPFDPTNDPEILALRARAAAQCPRYEDLVWEEPRRIFDQLCLLGMAAGWHPGGEVLVVPRYPAGVTSAFGKLVIIEQFTLDRAEEIAADLRGMQSDTAELCELYATWLDTFDPGGEHRMVLWRGSAGHDLTYFDLERI